MRRRRGWKGKAEDSIKRKMKGWAWILEEMGQDGMASGLAFFLKGEILFSLRWEMRMAYSKKSIYSRQYCFCQK